jgi:hypothetical protein
MRAAGPPRRQEPPHQRGAMRGSTTGAVASPRAPNQDVAYVINVHAVDALRVTRPTEGTEFRHDSVELREVARAIARACSSECCATPDRRLLEAAAISNEARNSVGPSAPGKCQDRLEQPQILCIRPADELDPFECMCQAHRLLNIATFQSIDARRRANCHAPARPEHR